MSSTVTFELYRVRRLMGDRVKPEPVVSTATLEELLYDAMDEISREVGAGDIVQTGFATVGPGATSVTVSSAYPAMRWLKHLVREIDDVPLKKLTHEQILNARAYGADEFSDPRYYTLVPGVDETILLLVYPTPSVNRTLTGVWEPVPSAVSQVSGTIYLEPTGLQALRALVAGRALLGLPDSELQKLGKTRDFAADLLNQASKAIADEWQRMQQPNLADLIVRDRG